MPTDRHMQVTERGEPEPGSSVKGTTPDTCEPTIGIWTESAP
jgi:hypothetical protein